MAFRRREFYHRLNNKSWYLPRRKITPIAGAPGDPKIFMNIIHSDLIPELLFTADALPLTNFRLTSFPLEIRFNCCSF